MGKFSKNYDEAYEQHDYKTLKGLRTHPLYRQLTDPQRLFLDEYIKSGYKRVQAARAAYTCSSDKSAATLASRILQLPAIKKLLAIHGDYEQVGPAMRKQEFLEAISNRLRSHRLGDQSFIKLATLLAELQGWTAARRESASDPDELLDDIVRSVEKAQVNAQGNTERQEAEEK